MMQFLMDILSGAEDAAIIVGLIIGVNLVKKAVEYGKENTENEKVKRWLEEIETGFETAVKAVNQRLVDGLKYEDAFNAEAQAKARTEAKKIFLESISMGARAYLYDAYVNVDGFIMSNIERKVADAKIEKQGTVLVSEGILVDEVVTAESTK